MKDVICAAILLLLATSAAYANEQPAPLLDAPGREVVENNCAACHSLDYLRTNSPFISRKMWKAEIDKMINVFGALIQPSDTTVIVDYLVQHYGMGE